jgi:hypothetical protein
MWLRSASTGQVEVYDISNNNVTNATSSGIVGLDFQIAGFGGFNCDGSTDIILRNSKENSTKFHGELEAPTRQSPLDPISISLSTPRNRFVRAWRWMRATGVTTWRPAALTLLSG